MIIIYYFTPKLADKWDILIKRSRLVFNSINDYDRIPNLENKTSGAFIH